MQHTIAFKTYRKRGEYHRPLHLTAETSFYPAYVVVSKFKFKEKKMSKVREKGEKTKRIENVDLSINPSRELHHQKKISFFGTDG